MLNIQSSGNLYGEHVTLKQISKLAAKKLFAANKEIYLQPSNMSPFSIWQSAWSISLDIDDLRSNMDFYKFCKDGNYSLPPYEPTPQKQFDSIINDYMYYNCDNERGNYVHFYKSI